MGTIQERKTHEKNKKVAILLGIGAAGAIVLAIILAFATGIFNPKNTDDPVGGNTQNDTKQETNTDEVVKPEPDSMQIVMVGDMLMHDKIIETGKKEDGTYNYDHLFANVAEFISAADLAIANQEVITAGPRYGYTGYPSFNSPYQLADAEAKAGFDVLLLASNHTLDKTKNGVLNCMEYLDTNLPDLGYVGINHSQEEQDNHIYTFEANGIKVAILNYTYGTNGIPLPADMPYIVNLLDEAKVRSDIRKAEEIADFTIVCPHWGTELKLDVDSNQKKWANIFVEEGADLVLGAHPHVIEPIEWVTHENGNEMLVYYSLGNFVNGTKSTGHGVTTRMIGGIANVTIQRNEETGKVEIAEYGAEEIVCHQGEKTDFTVYFLKDYTEEMASKNLIVKQDPEFSKALCESIFAQVWGE